MSLVVSLMMSLRQTPLFRLCVATASRGVGAAPGVMAASCSSGATMLLRASQPGGAATKLAVISLEHAGQPPSSLPVDAAFSRALHAPTPLPPLPL